MARAEAEAEEAERQQQEAAEAEAQAAASEALDAAAAAAALEEEAAQLAGVKLSQTVNLTSHSDPLFGMQHDVSKLLELLELLDN